MYFYVVVVVVRGEGAPRFFFASTADAAVVR